MLPTTLLGIALLVFSGVLVGTHLRSWRAAEAADLNPRDRQFAWRQFRRRAQTSAMVGIVAIAIMVTPLIMSRASTLVSVFYLLGLLLLVLWVILLALVDAIATRRHYGTLQRGELDQLARDNAASRRQQDSGNRRADEESPQ